MFRRNNGTYEFHQLGIPTEQRHPDERYSARFRMCTSDSPCSLVRTQWHRFEPDSALHPLSVPHAAFKVSDLAKRSRTGSCCWGLMNRSSASTSLSSTMAATQSS
jgi:hypothetical protein